MGWSAIHCNNITKSKLIYVSGQLGIILRLEVVYEEFISRKFQDGIWSK